MRLPTPRGPISWALFTGLRQEGAMPRTLTASDADDSQISLWALYELHYRGFDDVDDAAEWDPAVIAARRQLEAPFEAELRRSTAPLVAAALQEDGLVAQLERIVGEPGPALAAFLHREASREQYEQFLALRSLYHLKESDPQSWALPRLSGAPKAALAEIQYDEYGAGVPGMVHQQLYADALSSVGLDPTYGTYVDEVPAHTLAVNNAMSLFGLHRRLRGACVGHLAAFEMTSSIPCRRLAQGAKRLALPDPVHRYFDEHVEADAVHEQIAQRSLCLPLVEAEPDLHQDVLLGAATCIVLDGIAAEALLLSWTADEPTAVGAIA
ncbi:MAG: iron-containing redox enzyme family protein [Marmoricola sp.]|nr:iron-containing redox enzyme family protein [Marmoricola sp.]